MYGFAQSCALWFLECSKNAFMWPHSEWSRYITLYGMENLWLNPQPFNRCESLFVGKPLVWYDASFALSSIVHNRWQRKLWSAIRKRLYEFIARLPEARVVRQLIHPLRFHYSNVIDPTFFLFPCTIIFIVRGIFFPFNYSTELFSLLPLWSHNVQFFICGYKRVLW